MYKPDKRLKNAYDKYNRAFFDGALPSTLQIGWNDELGNGTYGCTLIVEDEEDTKHTIFQIHINHLLKGIHEQTHMTILHEMCHVKLHPYMQHGRKFQEEMKRLAGRDAFKGIW